MEPIKNMQEAEALARRIAERLSGSGFDSDWGDPVPLTRRRGMKIATDYHAMGDHGMYIGWIPLEVTLYVGRSPRDFRLTFAGANRRGRRLVERLMLREYLEDELVWALAEDTDVSPEHVRERMYE